MVFLKSIIFSVILISSANCSEQPNTVVQPALEEKREPLTDTPQMALRYQGILWERNWITHELIETNKPCSLYLSMIEKENGHTVIAKTHDTVHDQVIPELELSYHYYNKDLTEYFDSQAQDRIPALVGLELSDGTAGSALEFKNYAKNKVLESSMQLFFDDQFVVDDFYEVLEAVIHGEEATGEMKAVADHMNEFVGLKKHLTHVDDLNCRSTKLVEVTEYPSESAEHDDDDDDHGHGHGH